METFKKICKALLYPHTAVIICLIPVSTVLLLISFFKFDTEHPVSYVSYVLSAYTLTVVCMKIPKFVKYFKRVKNENEYVARYRSDAQLRVKISLYISVFINSFYAVFQLGLGLTHDSFWFYSLSAYYILLVLMRFFLLRDVRGLRPGEDIISEFKRYRFCGIILLIMNQVLVAIVFFMTYFGRTFEHHQITTIAMAAYTFTSMTLAIVNLIKYRKYKSPILSACKIVNLAAASVSMLTLESTMFSSFGSAVDHELQEHMIFITGAIVCIFIIWLAIFMISVSTKELKHLKDDQD